MLDQSMQAEIVDVFKQRVDFSREKEKVANAFLHVANQMARPCVLMRPMLIYSMEVQRWTVKYGDVEGVGPTPAEAMESFDKAWKQ